jgi:hypothetical protein
MRGRSLFLVGIVLLLAMLASGERAHITEEMPDTIERLIGNSYLHHFISTKSSIDINKFSVGSKVITNDKIRKQNHFPIFVFVI